MAAGGPRKAGLPGAGGGLPAGISGTVRLLRGLLVVAAVLPPALLAGASWQDWRRLEDEAFDRASRTAALLHEHALKVFQSHEAILDRVEDHVRGKGWDEIGRSREMHETLRRMAGSDGQISSVLLLAPDGRLAATSSVFPIAREIDNSDRGYYIAARDGIQGTYIGEPLIGRVSGRPILNVSRRRNASDGSFDGVVVVAVLLDYFSSFYRELAPDGADSVSLVRADGTVITRTPAVSTGVARVPASANLMRRITEGQERATFLGNSTLDGTERIYSFRRVGDYPVYVTYGLGVAAIGEAWLHATLIYGALAAASALGLVSMILLALRRARSEGAAIAAWRAEAAARATAEDAYEALYTRTPVPLHSVDAEGRLVGVSDRWLDFLGYARDDVLGKPVEAFMTEASARTHRELFWPRLLVEGRHQDVELQFVKRSGEIADVLMSARANRDAEGRFRQTFTVLVDVTDRKRAEAELLQARKMDAIGQLTGGVAHDFNNLLQAVYGCLRLVGRRVSDPQVLQVIETGKQAVERGARLTRQLTAFARRQPLRPEPHDIARLVAGMRGLLVRSLRENIRLELEFAEDLWPVMVDAGELELALMNLALNARDAMPSGGVLRVEAGNETLSLAGGAAEAARDFVRIRVTDSGSGMAPEILARAFEPFFTTKDVDKGTGLGLAMVYGFARQSGGDARIESTPGRGTTVTLRLPRSPAPVERPGPDAGLGEPAQGSGRILVVDDDASVAAATLGLLAEVGYDAHRAASPAEALELLEAGRRFDLVLTDVVMAGGSGLDLAREIGRRHPGLPVVLATGYAEALRDPGAAAWPLLRKPYTINELAEALRAAMGGPAAQVAGRNA